MLRCIINDLTHSEISEYWNFVDIPVFLKGK